MSKTTKKQRRDSSGKLDASAAPASRTQKDPSVPDRRFSTRSDPRFARLKHDDAYRAAAEGATPSSALALNDTRFAHLKQREELKKARQKVDIRGRPLVDSRDHSNARGGSLSSYYENYDAGARQARLRKARRAEADTDAPSAAAATAESPAESTSGAEDEDAESSSPSVTSESDSSDKEGPGVWQAEGEEEELREEDLIEPTRRIAVRQLDFTRISATDVYYLVGGFCPRGGELLSVDVYVTAAGVAALEREKTFGPAIWGGADPDGEAMRKKTLQEAEEAAQLLKSSKESGRKLSAWQASAAAEAAAAAARKGDVLLEQDDVSSDLSTSSQYSFQEDERDAAMPSSRAGRHQRRKRQEEARFNATKFRRAELERLKWHYAVCTFDSARTAAVVYRRVNGIDLLGTSSVIDLSYVPDDMSFSDEEREGRRTGRCTEPATMYTPPAHIANAAASQTDFVISWDRPDPNRTALYQRLCEAGLDALQKVGGDLTLGKKTKITRAMRDAADIGAYLASDSSTSEEADQPKPKTKAERIAATRQKYAALLDGFQGDADVASGSSDGSDSDSDVQRVPRAPSDTETDSEVEAQEDRRQSDSEAGASEDSSSAQGGNFKGGSQGSDADDEETEEESSSDDDGAREMTFSSGPDASKIASVARRLKKVAGTDPVNMRDVHNAEKRAEKRRERKARTKAAIAASKALQNDVGTSAERTDALRGVLQRSGRLDIEGEEPKSTTSKRKLHAQSRKVVAAAAREASIRARQSLLMPHVDPGKTDSSAALCQPSLSAEAQAVLSDSRFAGRLASASAAIDTSHPKFNKKDSVLKEVALATRSRVVAGVANGQATNGPRRLTSPGAEVSGAPESQSKKDVLSKKRSR